MKNSVSLSETEHKIAILKKKARDVLARNGLCESRYREYRQLFAQCAAVSDAEAERMLRKHDLTPFHRRYYAQSVFALYEELQAIITGFEEELKRRKPEAAHAGTVSNHR